MSITKPGIEQQSPERQAEIITDHRSARDDNDTLQANAAEETLRLRFSPGDVYITPGAHEALSESTELAQDFLFRHLSGDWGEVCEQDRAENEFSIERHLRILSAYRTKRGVRLWLITEADRKSTTLLLPEEY